MTLRQSIARHLVVASVVLGSCTASPCAETADVGIARYIHTRWTEASGAPSLLNALAQTADGYLWLGCNSGLYRFDGSSFEPVDEPGTGAAARPAVSALATDAHGGLWVGHGARSELLRIQDGVMTRLRLGSGDGQVDKIVVDAHDVAWVVANRRLWRVDRLQAAAVDAGWHLPAGQVEDVALARDGALLVELHTGQKGQVATIARLAPGAASFEATAHFDDDGDLVVAADGSLWSNQIFSIQRADAPASVPAKVQSFPIERTSPILVANDGGVWSMHPAGLTRDASLDALVAHRRRTRPPGTPEADGLPAKADAFTPDQGLSSAIVRTLFADREGNVWAGTDRGLDRFRRMPFAPIRLAGRGTGAAIAPAGHGAIWAASFDGKLSRLTPEGALEFPSIGPAITSLLSNADGELWVAGNDFDIWHADAAGRFARLPKPAARPAKPYVMALLEDGAGALWVGLDREQSPFRFTDGRWDQAATPAAAAGDHSGYFFLVDELGRVWESTGDAILVFDHGRASRLAADFGVGRIQVLHRRNRHTWIGGKLGLVSWDGQHVTHVEPLDGAPLGSVLGIVERANGDVWVRTQREVVLIEAAQFAGTAAATRRVEVSRYGEPDGLVRFSYSAKPAIIEADDGTLWVATDAGVAWAKPPGRRPAPRVIPVHILTLSADGKSYPPSGTPVLGELNSRAELTFSAVDLSSAERRRFRYRLEGVDHDWHDAGTRRSAQYNDLRPGHYAFVVQATDDRGAWQAEGDVLHFKVPPAWFQTGGVRSALAALAVLLAWLLHRWRARHLLKIAESRILLLVEARIAERDRIARDLHDTVLQGTTGLVLKLQVAFNRLAMPEPDRRHLDALLDEADRSVDEARHRVTGLRAVIDASGHFATALRRVGEQVAHSGGVAFELHADTSDWDFDPHVKDQLVLIVREALANACQHAHAGKVVVRLSEEHGRRVIRVIDDGIGFSVTEIAPDPRVAGHWGLFGMKERAAEIGARVEIRSAPGQGAEVLVRLPAAAPAPRRWWRR